MGLWEEVTVSSFAPREAFTQKKNGKNLYSFKHRRSSNWSLPSELGDLRNSLYINPCHFSYENEAGSGWTLLALPELGENELSWAGMGIFWWFLCAETQASGCKVAGTDRTAEAWSWPWRASCCWLSRQAGSGPATCIHTYLCKHTSCRIILGPCWAAPSKTYVSIGVRKHWECPNTTSAHIFKAGYKARFGINQTFSLLIYVYWLLMTWNLKLFQSWVFTGQSCDWNMGHTAACMMGRGGQKKLHGFILFILFNK